MTHLLALAGLAALCGGWVAFQIWLKKVYPVKEYRPGCGACAHNGSCSKRG